MMALECVSFSRIFLVGGDNETKRSCVFFCDDHVFQEFPRSQIKFGLAEVPGFMMV